MHSLPPNFDYSIIHGASVEIICFSRTSITVTVAEGNFIQIDGNFRLLLPEYSEWIDGSRDSNSAALINLVGRKISSVTNNYDLANLQISFDHGAKLILIGDNGRFESYRLQIGAAEIIV